MNNRQRGDYFERQTRDDLERRGWLIVRSGGSLGPFDLVAIRPHRAVCLVQCKINGRIAHDQWETLIRLAARFDCIPLLAWRPHPGQVAYQQLFDPEDEAKRTVIRKAWRPIDGRSTP